MWRRVPRPAPGKLASPPDALLIPRALEMVGRWRPATGARRANCLADKVGDEPTADLLQRLTVHEQTAWMLRSLLEE
jgi:starvation-inducible DNA-binding protein